MSRRDKQNEVQSVNEVEKVENFPKPDVKKAEVEAPVAAETLIYAGSSLPQGALQQYSVFQNGAPALLKDHIEKCPAIAQLMVPISQLPSTQANILLTGTREHTLDQQIKSYVRGGQ